MNFHLLNTFPAIVLCLSAIIVAIYPNSLGTIFLINLWGLSYPHTLSTFTKRHFAQTKFKILGAAAFITCLGVVLAMAYYYDLVMIMNLYFVLQLFHYIRQNYGVSRQFKNSYDAMDLQINGLLFAFVLFTQPSLSFFQFKVWTYPVDFNFSYLFFIHLSFVVYKRILLIQVDFKNIFSFEHIQYLLFSLFVLGSISFEFVWIGMNMVHNLQYLLVVNFQDHKAKFWQFYIPIFLISFVIIKSLDYIKEYFQYTLSISFIIVITLNLCHYFFDSFLWKRRFQL